MITMLMAYNENHPFKGLNKVYMVDECWVRWYPPSLFNWKLNFDASKIPILLNV